MGHAATTRPPMYATVHNWKATLTQASPNPLLPHSLSQPTSDLAVGLPPSHSGRKWAEGVNVRASKRSSYESHSPASSPQACDREGIHRPH